MKLLQHQFNTTFVYITHDQGEALVLSDHVAVMKDGKFEQVGFPQDLYHNPHTAFVAGFVGDRNCWAGRIVSSVDDTLKVKTESCMKIICNSVRLGSKKVGTQVKVFERPEFITTE